MTTIDIQYFAIFRELAGKGKESLTVTEGQTALNLYEDLKQKYCFPLTINELRIAINDEFADLNTALKNNDRVVFIPPVAGG